MTLGTIILIILIIALLGGFSGVGGGPFYGTGYYGGGGLGLIIVILLILVLLGKNLKRFRAKREPVRVRKTRVKPTIWCAASRPSEADSSSLTPAAARRARALESPQTTFHLAPAVPYCGSARCSRKRTDDRPWLTDPPRPHQWVTI